MESHYNYFNRDISWLSFNHRVLLEADDDTLPLFERINFIAIYSSNLEEFYQVRVAEHKAVASGGKSEDMTVDEAHALIRQITDTVNRQLEDRVRIYEEKIHHIADKMISIDLDDGVKVNYAKFQGVEVAQEGKKTLKVDLLAKI